VLAASFAKPAGNLAAAPIAADIAPLAHGMLELMAAAALLFGLALPLGRRLGTLNLQALLPPPRPMKMALPPRDFAELRAQAGENVAGVARLLQSWAEENE
jgi:flagellar M-ring protein FliF